MAENFKEIPFAETKGPEELDQLFKENLGIGFAECSEALTLSLKERAAELLEDLPNIAPYGNYDKLMENPDDILKFLQEEAAKPEHWKIQFVELKKDNDKLIELVFFNSAVDDGDSLTGFVFLGISGKIRHAFVQVHG